MGYSIDPSAVADGVPDLATLVGDPRIRPLGLGGGFALALVGAGLQLPLFGGFWATVLSGAFVFVAVPLMCLGLAAPDPPGETDPFHLGVELTPGQRRVVTAGSLLVLASPFVVAVLVPLVGVHPVIWLTAGFLALFGSVLIVTGFVAWTSKKLGETRPTP